MTVGRIPREVDRRGVPGRPGPRPGPPPARTQRVAAPTARQPRSGAPGGPPTPPGGRVPPGASGPKPPKPPRRKHPVRNWSLGILGALIIVPLLTFVVGWMIFQVPSISDAGIVQTATYTFAGGEPIAVVRPKDGNDNNINRNIVTIDKVPENVRQAVLAAEDRTFYSNPGFDALGIARAVYNQLTGGTGGGSTITQQYVKVSTGQDQASLWRKYKEVILSIKISKEQTKDQILENYLNTVYFGRGAYGIQAASQAYFGKDVGQLTVTEGAMLAGMIQSPSALDPVKNLAGTTIRWNYTLDQMATAGFITPAVRAQQVFPKDVLPQAPLAGGVPDDDRYHIFERAEAEMRAKGISQDEIDTGGLTVTTTIDTNRQKAAVDAVNKVMKGQPANLRSALVSVDPRSGAIQAYYGGSNGPGIDYAGDAVTRPPGSTFKPFVVAAALQNVSGFGLGTQYAGTSPMVIAGTKVANSDGDSCDQCSVMTAMTKSTNTVFYQIAVQVGATTVAQTAHTAGIPANLLPDPTGGISLGDKPVHVVDMASAYGTFAADGQHYDPYIVAKVTAADGRVLLDRGTSPEAAQAVFPQQLARNVTESMLDVATSSGFALSGRLAAAKTGTNQLGDTRDNRDAWTVGYTPSLSTAVWVGTDKSDPIRTKSGAVVYGRTLPGPIWQQFMNAALKGAPKDTFSAFEPLGTAAYANNDPSGSSSSYYSSTTPTASPDGNGNDNGNDNNDGNGGNRNRGNDNGNDDGNNQGAAFVLPAAGHSVKLRSHSVVG
jgi:membrane peptidoglycan carboxypeptidase